MSIDLSQFHQVFFEESFDGLDIMEQGLLNLSTDQPDSETINSIFRAAHSIKGGSATFHFTVVAEFTHVLETLLDEVRNGDRAVTSQMIDLLLKSVDCLRTILSKLQAKKPVNKSDYKPIEDELTALIENETNSDSISLDSDPELNDKKSMPSKAGETIWQIEFIPESYIVRTGNEPIRMFRELESLGELTVEANTSKVPYLEELEEDSCYLSWSMTLVGDIEKSAIEEVFEWVVEDCQLSIEIVESKSATEENERKAESSKPNQSEDNVHADSKNSSETKISVDTKSTIKTAPKLSAGSSASVEKQLSNTAESSEEKSTSTVASATSSSIRVGIDKVDSLINLVGELVITQSMLGQMGEEFDITKLERLKEGLMQLEQNTRELQESVMQIRMLPISFVFNRFPRMVRDLCGRFDKKVDLIITGENTELDKTVMEQIGDPLVHLVRNSLDHGIETPEIREAAGKSATGKVELNAFHQGGNIVIEIVDDGAGINREKVLSKAIERGLVQENQELSEAEIDQLIFEPGFSTADVVSDVSGRGVGMDVVKKNINALGGSVYVESTPGVGSTFSIRLPLTLAILDGQLIRVGSQTYVVPLTSIVESIQIKSPDVLKIAGGLDIYKLRDDHVPILKLYDTFNIDTKNKDYHNSILVVVETGGKKIGFMVDELLSQQQVVIKSLETNFIAIEGISGATILGDGRVALILDVLGMLKRLSTKNKNQRERAA
ncbi:MAG: chemotaxis protein CheA [Gammaproteobacteria bacterium]|nr:chemotaxis protein CheA [Gammaproteobacteria bacterium]